MFRDPTCSSECQKKCSISDRQSADTPPDSSNSAVESVRKIIKSALQTKWQSFNMPFGLSLILHPANSFKKGKVPIVKQMLPVMVRSVCATKYTVEHLRKTIAKHWGTSRRHTRVDTDGCCRPWTFHKNGSAQKNSHFTVAIQKFLSLKLC